MLGADEFHQFVGVAEFTDFYHAGRNVAAQRDDALDAVIAIGLQQFADFPRVEPMHDRCGAACRPACWISSTALQVPRPGWCRRHRR